MPNHHEGEILAKPYEIDSIEASRSSLRLGEDIRHLRKAKRLTLGQVASMTGLSSGFISQIENGQNRPSVTALFRISRALGVSVGWFFPAQEDSVADTEVSPAVRHGKRRRLVYDDGIVDELLTPGLGGKLELLSCRFAPGSGVDTMYSHEGEEAGIVLKGRLELWVDDTCLQLEAGDSFGFDSSKPHRYRNPSDEETQVIWAITPPSF
jgi:transcriptional regulator with XRE-family HTH domain